LLRGNRGQPSPEHFEHSEDNMTTKTTKAQQLAILSIWLRNPDGKTFLQFRRSVKRGFDCLMVEWCGMWLGIESDGHTHS